MGSRQNRIELVTGPDPQQSHQMAASAGGGGGNPNHESTDVSGASSGVTGSGSGSGGGGKTKQGKEGSERHSRYDYGYLHLDRFIQNPAFQYQKIWFLKLFLTLLSISDEC